MRLLKNLAKEAGNMRKFESRRVTQKSPTCCAEFLDYFFLTKKLIRLTCCLGYFQHCDEFLPKLRVILDSPVMHLGGMTGGSRI